MVYSDRMATENDPLCSIVGDGIRVKLLRLFVCNIETVYIAGDFMKALRKQEKYVKEALKRLERDGILKRKKIPSSERRSRGIREMNGYAFNKRYPHRVLLERIVAESAPDEKEVLVKRISRVPGVQCVVTDNIFTDKAKSGVVDLLVVSSADNEPLLKEAVRNAERIIGRELRCVFLSVNELLYRVQVSDKFIRDIMDAKYRVHMDKTGVFSG